MPRGQNETWAVTVERNGEQVVTLASNCLAGRDLSDEDERVIRSAAEHLLAFIGASPASLLHAGAEQGWQSMDTAPEATWVLVFVPNYGINIATMTRDPNMLGPNGAFWFIRGDDDRCWPALWTPIPPLPSAAMTAPDEEMVPHAFVAMSSGAYDEIWCADCEYHRDHAIHSSFSTTPNSTPASDAIGQPAADTSGETPRV